MTLEKSKAHQQWYKAMFLLPTILKLIKNINNHINSTTILVNVGASCYVHTRLSSGLDLTKLAASAVCTY